MKLFTPYDDITGDGSAHSLATLLNIKSQPCAWFQITLVDNTSGSTIRVGDETISATRGIPIGGTDGVLVTQFAPVNGQDRMINYDLKDVWLLIPNGDKVSVAYAV